MIKYYLKKNPLNTEETNYVAQIASKGTFDYEKIIDKILSKGTTLTRPDLYAALEALNQTIKEVIEDGYNVSMPLYNIGYSITGTFANISDQFDPQQHTLNINFTRSAEARRFATNIKHEKVATPASPNVIAEYYDTTSATLDNTINPGGGFIIMGENIKLLGDDPTVGLYFIAADGTETPCTAIIENRPKKITGINPTLTAGTYHLRIITQYNGSRKGKTKHTVDYDINLTVT